MTSDDEAVREWAARLFKSDDDPAPAEPDRPGGNVVPGEGANPRPADRDLALHEFARELFGRDN